MPSLLDILGVLVGFLPQVFVLYLILSLIEKSGLLALLARGLHLPVNNVLPICLSFDCTTLAICAARQNSSRKRLVHLLSFLPCTAQLPLLTFILLTILGLPFWSLLVVYLMCIGLGIIVVSLLPNVDLEPNNPMVLPLKWPNIWLCFLDTLKQTLLFAKKILIAFIVSAFVIVILARFSFSWQQVTNPEQSILFAICGFLAPIFSPIGLNQPVIICALIFGLIAKEAAISVLLFFPDMVTHLSLPVLLSLVVFYVLYPKCLAAQTAINSHCGRKTGFRVLMLNLVVAYVMAFVVYNLCGFII